MDKKFIHKLRETIRIFEREIFFQNNASCCSGVSLTQCHFLIEIEKNKEISISDLANNLSLDKSTVSRTVEGLVNINWVDRVIPKENRRKALLDLTESGKKVCSKIHSANNTYIKKVLIDFSENEQKELLRLLKRLTANMCTTGQVNCEN